MKVLYELVTVIRQSLRDEAFAFEATVKMGRQANVSAVSQETCQLWRPDKPRVIGFLSDMELLTGVSPDYLCAYQKRH